MTTIVFGMITTRRSREYTAHALTSFFAHTSLGPNDRFVLIDNDRSLDREQLVGYPGTEVIENLSPRSFAANANRLMAEADHLRATLLLLNNDLIFTPGWLPPLLVDASAVSSPVSNRELEYRSNNLHCRAVMDLEDYLGRESELEEIAARNAAAAPGSKAVLSFPFFCVSIPYAVYSKVGLFDESFGAGGAEDRDYAIRCHIAGFELRYALSSYVLHFQGKSTWRGGESDAERRARIERYERVFEAKWGKRLLSLLVRQQGAVLDSSPGLREAAAEGRWADVIAGLLPLEGGDSVAVPEDSEPSPKRRVPDYPKRRRIDRMSSQDSGSQQISEPTADRPTLEFFTSRQFTAWMAEQGISLAATSYQTGKLMFFGVGPEGRLSVFERTFDRAMGLHGDGQTLFLSTLYLLWRFENVLPTGQLADGYDRLYIPQVAYTTGDIDIHDLNVDAEGRLVFVNTLFGCLATTSETHSFEPLWKPPFISRLAAEDRCHLNGLALKGGVPAYVTCVSQTDVADGWRDRRRDGGTIVDVRTDEIVATGLSMPHSPRWHHERLWLIEAGSGHFGALDLESGEFERLVFCPGYLRGLAFAGDFAIVGSSKLRESRTFEGLELGENPREKNVDARCGLFVIDLRTGDVVHWMRIDGIVEELYDVIVLPGVRRPSAIGLRTDEIRRTLSIADQGSL